LRLHQHQRPHDARARGRTGADFRRRAVRHAHLGPPRRAGQAGGALALDRAHHAAGQIGSAPVPPGQQFAYTVRAPGRLKTVEEFANIVIRARPDGSVVRVKDVGRVELGAQTYNVKGRLNGKPAAVIAVYQLPGSNAIETVKLAKALMAEAKTRFPDDLEYTVSLDTTLAVTAGIREIVQTLFEALALVIVVVFLFLQ